MKDLGKLRTPHHLLQRIILHISVAAAHLNGIPCHLHDHLGRKAVVDEIKMNPFALSVTIEGFAMNDPDGERFVGVK